MVWDSDIIGELLLDLFAFVAALLDCMCFVCVGNVLCMNRCGCVNNMLVRVAALNTVGGKNIGTAGELTVRVCVCVNACDCSVTSLYRILFIKNSKQDEKLITCCTADNVFKGGSWKYLLQSIVDNRLLQESGLAIHINDCLVLHNALER